MDNRSFSGGLLASHCSFQDHSDGRMILYEVQNASFQMCKLTVKGKHYHVTHDYEAKSPPKSD